MQIEVLNATAAARHLPQLMELLKNAVDHGASIGYLPPASDSEALSFWQRVLLEISAGKRLLVGALEEGVLIGCVQLQLADQPNAPHRAEVQKLFVHTEKRGLGAGRLLLERVVQEAKRLNRTLLILDVKDGEPAHKLCLSSGFQTVGVVPGYSKQATGEFADTVIMYMKL